MLENAARDGGERDLALALVAQVAHAIHEHRGRRCARIVARVEQHAIALDDAVELLARVEARRRRSVPVRRQGVGTEQHLVALAPRAHAPFDVLPVERIVGPAGGKVARKQRRAKQGRAAARAKLKRSGCGRRRVIEPQPGRVDVPVGESGLLAPAARVRLKDLRADREHALAAQRQQCRERASVERHVVVQQIRAARAHAREPALDRAGEPERGVAMLPLDFRVVASERVVFRLGRPIGDDHDLRRLADLAQRVVCAHQCLAQHVGRIALGDDDADAGRPRADGRGTTRTHEWCERACEGRRQGERREAQALPPTRAPHDQELKL